MTTWNKKTEILGKKWLFPQLMPNLNTKSIVLCKLNILQYENFSPITDYLVKPFFKKSEKLQYEPNLLSMQN